MPTESSPLLRRPTIPHIRISPTDSHYTIQNPRVIALLLAFTLLCVSAAESLASVPTTRLLEDVICTRYYHDGMNRTGGIDESMCKIDDIQSELAWFTGGLTAIEAMVEILVAFPYGILADYIGRKPVFVLAITGIILNITWIITMLNLSDRLPIQLIFLSPLFEIIGGGNSVLLAMTYSIVADTSPTANRSDSFLRMSVARYLGNVIASAAASHLMTTTPWTPLLMAFALLPIAAAPIIFIPDLSKSSQPDHDDFQYTDLRQEFGIQTSRWEKVVRALTFPFRQLAVSVSILSCWSAFVVLFAFILAAPVQLGATKFIVQYASMRFDISLATAGYLRSLRSFLDIAVLLIILPLLSMLLQSHRLPFQLSASEKDLSLARFSALLIAVGSLLISWHPLVVVIVGLVLLTLGDGFTSLCRSIMISFVNIRHASKLFTLISMIETLGALVTGPAFAWLFSKGLTMGSTWQGLPYLALSCLACSIALLFWFVKLEDKGSEHDMEESRFDDIAVRMRLYYGRRLA